jgi:hypothetical protein
LATITLRGGTAARPRQLSAGRSASEKLTTTTRRMSGSSMVQHAAWPDTLAGKARVGWGGSQSMRRIISRNHVPGDTLSLRAQRGGPKYSSWPNNDSSTAQGS